MRGGFHSVYGGMGMGARSTPYRSFKVLIFVAVPRRTDKKGNAPTRVGAGMDYTAFWVSTCFAFASSRRMVLTPA